MEASDRLLQTAAGSPEVDDHTRSNLVYALIEVDDIKRVEAIANTIEDETVLTEIITTLLESDDVSLARRLSKNITSPVQQVYAAISIAETFLYLDRMESVYELSSIAVEILQDRAFYEDDNLTDLVDSYRQERPSLATEEIHRIIRESFIYDLVNLLSDDSERLQLLLQEIEDESFRENLIAGELAENATDSDGQQSDSDWSRLASEAAKEGNFLQAVEAVSLIESPYEQARSLINIAQCHAYSTTELDAETELLLQEIQQRAVSGN